MPIVIGLPNAGDLEAGMAGYIILQGCVVYSDEPERPIACAACGWFGEQVRSNTIRAVPPSQAFGGERGEEDQ